MSLETFKFKIHLSVYEQIRSTIGRVPPESGGFLGGDLETYTVRHFLLDSRALCTRTSYSPDCAEVNRVLNELWNPAGTRLLGFVHSHPGHLSPSPGDELYVRAILHKNPELPFFLLPIVSPAVDGRRFSLDVFVARRQPPDIEIRRIPLVIFDDDHNLPIPIIAKTDPPDRLTLAPYLEQPIFDRIRSSVSLPQLYHSRIIWVGAGGSLGLIKDLARSGVREHVVIDPDQVSAPNLATQDVNITDVGRAKVEVAAEAIQRINPLSLVTPVQKPLEQIDDDEFRALAFHPLPGDSDRPRGTRQTLIIGCTDAFSAQARINRLGLHFELASVCAQLYAEGYGGEITFCVQGVTAACHRCILSGRYAAHLRDGFKPITSSGTVPIATTWLNAVSAFVSLAVLHATPVMPDIKMPRRWAGVLHSVSTRNLVQLRFHPEFSTKIQIKNFEEALSGANPAQLFCGEVIWRPQRPENPETGHASCPDCGGGGDLKALAGSFQDTRILKP